MRDIPYHVQQLRSEGLTLIPDVYTQGQCAEYIKHAENIIHRFIESDSPLINNECQFIVNAFRHNPKFLEFIYHDFLDEILKILLDEDHVLIATTMINKRRMDGVKSGGHKIPGGEWHTDSRYLDGGKRMEQGLSYIALITLNDFKVENGATQFVVNSHKLRERPERNGNYDHIAAEAKAGTMLLFDSGMWHRSGSAGTEDRWSVTSYYGPWFMKPYFRFPDMLLEEFGEEFVQSLTPAQRRLLHFNSTPPIHEDERLSTVIKEGEHPLDKLVNNKKSELPTSNVVQT